MHANEKSGVLRIGFIPLADCAPLVVAQELELFARHGLQVELCKAQSWDQIITRLNIGDLDAAHALITIPLQWAMSLSGRENPLLYAVVLCQHGNAITLSNALWRKGVRDAATLKSHVEKHPEKRLQFAVVYPRSTHEYLLRLWLQTVGLEVGRDIELKYVAPPEMVHQLREGGIDGFCVGEPWNQRAVSSKLGYIVATSSDVLPPMGEKVLAVRSSWHGEHLDQHAALVRVVSEAGAWLEAREHRMQAAEWVASKRYVNSPPGPIRAALLGEIDAGGGRLLRPPGFLRFGGANANFPDATHARFYLEQMWRFGHVAPEQAQDVNLRALCREEFYRACAG